MFNTEEEKEHVENILKGYMDLVFFKILVDGITWLMPEDADIYLLSLKENILQRTEVFNTICDFVTRYTSIIDNLEEIPSYDLFEYMQQLHVANVLKTAPSYTLETDTQLIEALDAYIEYIVTTVSLLHEETMPPLNLSITPEELWGIFYLKAQREHVSRTNEVSDLYKRCTLAFDTYIAGIESGAKVALALDRVKRVFESNNEVDEMITCFLEYCRCRYKDYTKGRDWSISTTMSWIKDEFWKE